MSAERSGDQVLLRWTTPSRTTDDMEVKGPMTAQICRETDIRPSTPIKPSTPAIRLAACQPVRRITVVPGRSEVTETLPPSLQADPVRLITYRIQILNSAGRSAGDSAVPAYAAAGQAPPDVAGLQARAAEPGAVLEWQSEAARKPGAADLIDLKRVDISAAAPERRAKPAAAASSGAASGPHPRKSQPSRTAQPKPAAEDPPNEVHLRAPDVPAGGQADTAGTVDTTAAMGETYTYIAQRVRPVTLGSRQLEIASSPSTAVTLALRDTFPPKPPAGLETISGSSPPDTAAGGKPQPYIDLSWEPSSEPDLAGYRVYRQLARPDGSPQGPLARLTALPIAVPAYRDVAVTPGQRYIYSVTAVDAAGNESAPSAKALEAVSGLVPEAGSPEAGQPPN